MSLSQDITNLVTATNNLTNTVNNKIAAIDNHVNTAINNVVNAKAVTYHVDALNGNDNNDGSPGSPFQTIKKACDSVPIGGKGVIRLVEGQTHLIDNHIIVVNKVISIVGMGSNKPTIQAVSYSDASFNYLYGFLLSGSSVNISDTKVRLSDRVDQTLGWGPGAVASLFSGMHPAGVNFIRIGSSDIILPSDAYSLCTTGIGSYAIITHLLLENSNITVDGGYIYYLQGNAGVGTLSARAVTLEDSTGGSIAWSNVVGGIIKDSNGVPRNIMSNIIF